MKERVQKIKRGGEKGPFKLQFARLKKKGRGNLG